MHINNESFSKKNLLGLILSSAVIVYSLFLPGNSFLSDIGIRTVAVILAFLIIMITEALPVFVASILFCSLLPLLNITKNMQDAFYGFSQPTVFFTLISFAIALAITKVPLSDRLLRLLLLKFGKNVKMILLSIMICCAAVSSFVSNVPTCAIFMTIALKFIDLSKNETQRKNLGRTFMIAVPIASMIGGAITPVGSTINLIGIAQLEKLTGLTVTFVEWTCVALPVSIIMLLLAWWIMIKVYKPVEMTNDEIKAFVDSIEIPEKYMSDEKKVVVIIAVMFVFWIMSSWVKGINVTLVTLFGGIMFFLPGIRILNVKTFLKNAGWDAFFLCGVMFSITNLLIENGVTDIISKIMPELHVSIFILIGFTALLTFLLLIIIPVAPSLVPILAVALVTLGINSDVSPKILILTATICACNCYLLPLDTVPLITYSKGYYKFTDMIRSTAFMQLALIIILALWIPFIGRLLGMI